MSNGTRGHSACAAADDDPYLQELIRGSVPGPSARARVAPLTDDEIGRFDCAICMEPRLAFDRFRAAAGACAHEFCVCCLVRYIEGRVADGAVPVPCPAPGCRDGVMHPEACKKLLDIDVFDAWCVALCERAIGPGRVRCPHRGCGELVVLEAGDDAAPVKGEASKVACPTCNRAFCLQCEGPWDDRHGGGGEGCVLAQLAQGRDWTRCPSCRAMIDKIDGCKRMSCRIVWHCVLLRLRLAYVEGRLQMHSTARGCLQCLHSA
ncbi:hypothetical protein ACP70R_006353 [Stipagrostis hirtigluma subsp. patula]